MKHASWIGAVAILFLLSVVLAVPQTPAKSQEITPSPEVTPLPTEEAEAEAEAPEAEPADAATGDATAEGDAAPDGADAVATPAPVSVVHVRPVTPINAEVTLRQLGEENVRLNGLYSYAELWIPLPANWVTDYLELQLTYASSPLIHQDRASLTVLVNDREATSFRLGRGNEQTITFPLPVEYVDQGNGFSLAFAGFLKTTDYVCEEADNPGQWVTILDTTVIRLGANPNTSPPDLQNVTRLLVPHVMETPPSSLMFVLPDDPDATALTAAGNVAARIGYVSDTAPLQVRTASSVTDAELATGNIVVVGLPENQPLIQRLADTLPARTEGNGYLAADGLVVPGEHGVIQFVRSPWNATRYVLLVSAGDEAGLEVAGRAFANRGVFRQLRGAYKFVESVPAELDEVRNPWAASEVTFASLGASEALAARGAGLSRLTYYFRWPPGWTFGQGGQLFLDLALSPAIQVGSHIVVHINEVLVGSDVLAAGDQKQRVVFRLPEQAINETLAGSRIRSMKLVVSVANVLPADECRSGDTELAWVRIQPDSYFVLPHQWRQLPDLQVFPYPFVSDDPQPVALVLPDEATEQDLGAALSIAAQLGSYSLRDLNLAVVAASDFSPASYSDAHLIVLGTSMEQPWISEFVRDLPPLATGSVYHVLDNAKTGMLIERPTPWNSGLYMLLVFGDTPDGYARAASALYTLPPVDNSTAVVLFEEDEAPQHLTLDLGVD